MNSYFLFDESRFRNESARGRKATPPAEAAEPVEVVTLLRPLRAAYLDGVSTLSGKSEADAEGHVTALMKAMRAALWFVLPRNPPDRPPGAFDPVLDFPRTSSITTYRLRVDGAEVGEPVNRADDSPFSRDILSDIGANAADELLGFPAAGIPATSDAVTLAILRSGVDGTVVEEEFRFSLSSG